MQRSIGRVGRSADSDETLPRDLVARGHDDVRTGIDVGAVDRADLTGRVGQDPSRPQRVAEVMAPGLEFGRQTTVDGADTAIEEVIDGDQM